MIVTETPGTAGVMEPETVIESPSGISDSEARIETVVGALDTVRATS